MKHRNMEWWNEVITGVHGNNWWHENLRMSRGTFVTVCDHLEQQCSNFRECISVEVRVAVTIWRLTTNTRVSNHCGIIGTGQSAVGEIVLDT